MTVTNEKIIFDSCRGSNHKECSGVFTIGIQSGGDYTALCQCDCHNSIMEPKETVKAETTTLYEVDFISMKDLDKLTELAVEAETLWSFDPNFFLAAIFVSDQALNNSTGGVPSWKAYDEAKDQIIQGSEDTITLCTGTIEDGYCKVCHGVPGVVFTDTDSDLELHVLKEFLDPDEEDEVSQLILDLPSEEAPF